MREKDYILATNLAKARIAQSVLKEIHFGEDNEFFRDEALEIQRTLYRWIAKWERNV